MKDKKLFKSGKENMLMIRFSLERKMIVGKQITRKLFEKLVAIGKERERGREKNEKERDNKK